MSTEQLVDRIVERVSDLSLEEARTVRSVDHYGHYRDEQRYHDQLTQLAKRVDRYSVWMDETNLLWRVVQAAARDHGWDETYSGDYLLRWLAGKSVVCAVEAVVLFDQVGDPLFPEEYATWLLEPYKRLDPEFPVVVS